MPNILDSIDTRTYILLSTLIFVAIIALTSLYLTYLNTKRSHEDLLKDYQEKVSTIAKSFSDQENKENENGKIHSSINGNNNLYSNITLAKKNDKFDDEKLIELAVHQTFMESHQKQALTHSKIQFYTGLFMSITGFLLIIYVVAFELSSNSITNVITIAGSIIIEGISILFLKESHKLRESAKEYHDNLSENQKQLQAIKIAESIEDLEIKSAIKAQLALHMIGINSDNVDTTKILEVMNKE